MPGSGTANDMPIILSHIYWVQKAQFQLREDTQEDWVAFAVEEGSFRYRIGSLKGAAGSGDTVFCPPHVPFIRETITPLTFHYLLFAWRSDWAGGRIRLSDKQRHDQNMAYMRNLKDAADADSFALKSHLLHDLLLLSRLDASAAALPDETSDVRDPLMARAAGLLGRSAFKPLSQRNIAAALGLSPVQFTRRFQAAYSMTPSAYIRQLRLKKAKSLLVETSWQLERIADLCGYDNGFYFSRVFKEGTGMSPSVYRKLHRL